MKGDIFLRIIEQDSHHVHDARVCPVVNAQRFWV
jgi:hypothetical protein